MKKHYFIFIAIAGLFTIQSHAQTLTATGINATVGENFIYVAGNYFSPGGAGTGQTWNFSTLTGTNSTANIVAVGTTPNGSSFPQATYAASSGGAYSYQKTSATASQNYGYDAGGTVIAYSDPEDQLHFPFAFGNTYTDSWAATFVSGGYNFTREGSTTVTADGTGTLTTPAGTFTNVVRIHFVQNYTDSTNIAGNPYIITYTNDEYMWYKDGTHYQLAATYTITNSATGTSSAGFYLITTVGVEENSVLASSIQLFPNPASENIQVKYNLENATNVQLSIINIAGQTVFEEEITNFCNGENSNTIDVSEFERGTYFVRIQTNDAVVTRKIEVQ